MVGCFIVSPTHVSYKTVPNILPWWEKHHLASTSFDQKGLCPEQIQPSTLGDAWGIMEIPAIARLEGLKVKVKNPWTKNDIFNWHLYVHFWWNCAILLSDLLYFHVTSWAQKHAEVPDSLCLRLAVHICTSSSSRPWSHGSIADNLTTGFFWVQIWSKYNEARGNLKAARITATMNSQLWHMHLWWILWLVWYCPCLAHSYFWFDFGRAPGSNSLKCAAIASWKARIQKSNQKKQFFPLQFLNFFLSESKKHGEKGWVLSFLILSCKNKNCIFRFTEGTLMLVVSIPLVLWKRTPTAAMPAIPAWTPPI